MLLLIQQTRYLLNHLLAWQEEDFKKHGGVRERMHAARTEARGDAWERSIYSLLNQAKDITELNTRLNMVIDSARRTVQNIKYRNGW